MGTLEQAIALAANAHEGQKDKSGKTYILHPLRVMMKMTSESEMIVAILHDVVEDCGVTFEDLLQEGFSPEIVQAVDGVSRRRNESYSKFIDRSLRNPIARKVKIADLEDNMDVKRIRVLGWRDRARLQQYHQAWMKLTRPESV